MEIRKFRKKKDFQGVLDLIIKAYSDGGDLASWPPEECKRYAEIYATQTPLCFVACDDTGQIIGTVLAYVLPKDPGIVHLEVLEPGSGEVAKQLYDAVVAEASKRNIPGIRPENCKNVTVKAFVPGGERSQFLEEQGCRISKTWVYCEHLL